MVDSRRVFVQLAVAKGPVMDVSAPVMAFVLPTDPWLTVVNEFLMSCNDDDVEVTQREPGLLHNCVVLLAASLEQVTESASCEDGRQYILCMNADDAARLKTQKFGGSSASCCTGTNDDNVPPGRESIALTDQLESLEELDYYFDDAGTLRHCRTNQAVYELMGDERRAGELDDIVKAAIFHIQMEMLAELAFKQARVPLDIQPHEPKEARTSVFLTSDWRTNSNLLVVVNGGRGAQPGIWSRDLLIQEGLELGSMLPVMRRATAGNFAVAVLNPSTNNVTIRSATFSIRENSSPDEHMLYVWDNIISRAQARNVYVLAYSFGAKSVVTLIRKREEQVVQRVNAIVFAEGAYRMDPSTSSSSVAQFLKQRAINFKGDARIPVGGHIPAEEEKLSCSCLSVGDLTAPVPSDDGKASPSAASASVLHKRSSSNKARTISLSLETTFTYFVAARDRGCSAAQFIHESETRTRTWLGNVIRHRLDSLKPRKQSRRLSTAMGANASESSHHRKTARRSSLDTDASTSALRASVSSSRGSNVSHHPHGVSVSDFDLIKVIGKGSIGKVFLVRKKDTSVVYAMKVLRKKNVVRHGLEEHIKTERLILEEIDHPFIARLRFSFQTKDKLYLVTDYCSGGELFHHMSDEGFSYELCRFYAAELVLGLEHLHRLTVAYRDLKPENILVEASGHLRITDFGLSKLNVVSDKGAQTLVGSPEYLAPEVYNMQKYGFAVDWWSLGVFLYEMLTGIHPFFDDNREIMVKKIMTPGLVSTMMPPEMPLEAASIICGLLTFNPTERLGSRGAQELRDHAFFAGISWDGLMRRKVTPPWHPVVHDEMDVGNFDAEFTSEPVVDSVCTHQSMVLNATFADFTFNPSISESMRNR
uniref:non-specific serine/threonine protein kinase n=1 Tax=Peronospora matthiolae TaxID=2874970 RepID=A0AAV1VP25_9STRA